MPFGWPKGSDRGDSDILASMLEGADLLCKTNDALIRGQYEHLRGRIRALLELRAAADGKAGE